MLNKQLGSVLILLMVSTTTTNGYSTLRGRSKNKITPHPALSSMVGSWEAKNGVTTTIHGPETHFNGTWLSVTEADQDGNIYLKHDGQAQLMRVQNDKMQYCFNYEAPAGEGSDTAPFQLMSPGYNGNDASTTVDFCWRGPRLPTHKADCTGCECAHWQLQLGTDGKSMKSIMWQSFPAIHFEVELTKSDTIMSTEEVVDGWQCEFQDSTGQPDNHDDLIHHHGGSNCPYLKFKSERVKSSSSSSSSSSLPAKFSLLMTASDTVHEAHLDYTVPQIPCIPCNVSFAFSVLTDEEDDYIALGFRGGVYSYTDWNDKTADENRTSGGFPDYFGMSTSSDWDSIYGPQPINGRIALGYVNDGRGYFREMEATHYVGAPSDIEDKEPLLKGTDVERVGGWTIIRFTSQMYAGSTIEDLDWNPSATFSTTMSRQRVMWATGSVYGDGSEATVGFHGPTRAISPLGFPGFNEPTRKYIDDIIKEEEDDAKTKPYLSFN